MSWPNPPRQGAASPGILRVLLLAVGLVALPQYPAASQVSIAANDWQHTTTGTGDNAGFLGTTWTDASCAASCDQDQTCGFGVTAFNHDYPDGINCDGVQEGQVKYYDSKLGLDTLMTADEGGCQYNEVVAGLHGYQVCSNDYQTNFFDYTLDAASLYVGDGSLRLQQIAYELDYDKNTNNQIDGTGYVCFDSPDDPGGCGQSVFAYFPILTGVKAKYGDYHHLREWTALAGDSWSNAGGTVFDGTTQTVDDAMIRVWTGSNHAKADDSFLLATLLGIPCTGDDCTGGSAVGECNVRAPFLAAISVAYDQTFSCPLMASAYCPDGGACPTLVEDGDCKDPYVVSVNTSGEVTVQLDDLRVDDGDVIASATVFLQGVALNFKDDDGHQVRTIMASVGDAEFTDPQDNGTGDGTYFSNLSFTPAMKIGDNNNHDYTDDSNTVTAVLAVFFENTGCG